eukprot:2875435-Pyramimonas_sp.AAC.1
MQCCALLEAAFMGLTDTRLEIYANNDAPETKRIKWICGKLVKGATNGNIRLFLPGKVHFSLSPMFVNGSNMTRTYYYAGQVTGTPYHLHVVQPARSLEPLGWNVK